MADFLTSRNGTKMQVSADDPLPVTSTSSSTDQGLIGALTETAPATDTASSGLNGRLQRIAQRLTSLIALLPASLGIKTAAASLSIAPASDAQFVAIGNVASAAVDSGNPVKVGGVFMTTNPTFTDTQRGDLQIGTRGSLRVELTGAGTGTGAAVASSGADAVTNSTVGLYAYTRPSIYNGTAWDRDTCPNLASRILSAAASTNATSAKASAGKVHLINGFNAAVTARYLKIYNKASAPTVGTDTPILTLYLPGSSAFSFMFPNSGMHFATGIAYALTTGSADNDTGALTAADVLGLNLLYS